MHRFAPAAILLLLCTCLCAAVHAEPVDPAAEAKNKSEGEAEGTKPAGTHSWDAPAIKVPGFEAKLKEEERIGSYGQPRWSAHRRFNRTRQYVRPEGQIDFEIWSIHKGPRRSNHGDEAVENEWQTELEFGLPYRFQFDAYLVLAKTGREGELELAEEKFELRWAFMDWGKIYSNPTLYFEYAIHNHDFDSVEVKLLLGDSIIPRLHWGVNLVYEHVLGGDHNNNFAFTAAISYTVIDSVLAIGWEHQSEFEDSADNRWDFEDSHITGPSIQIRPSPQAHLNLVPFFGVGGHSPAFKFYFVFGWEF